MKEYVFGVDVGGTTIKLGLFNVDGDLIEKWEIPTNTANNGEAILKDISDAVQKKISDRSIDPKAVAGIGMGIPGPVDRNGVVNHCVNLGWGVVAVEEELQKLSGYPVKAGNDANVAAMGEAFIGAGKGTSSILMVTLGTGVGAGIVIDGKIVAGHHGAAGECGHIHVMDNEPEACGCGNHGCLEQYASATGIVRMANRMLADSDEDSTLRDLDEITAKDVFDEAKNGDVFAGKVVHEVCEILGKALAKMCNVINPEMVVIGGGVSHAGQIILNELDEAFRTEVFHGARETKIALATLGNDAGIYGGAGMVIEML